MRHRICQGGWWCAAPASTCAPASPCSRAPCWSSPCSTGLALRGDGPAPGVPVVPRRRASRTAGSRSPTRSRTTPTTRTSSWPRRAGDQPRALRALAGRRGRDGGARRALAPAGRGRGRARAGVDPDLLEGLVFLESAGREDAMAGDTEGAVGLTQILAETGPEPARDAGRRRAQPRLTRRIERAFRRGRHRRGRRRCGRSAAGRRALRPGQGAGRHRALPDDRARGAGPRGPRVRLLPHGDREPPGRAAAPTARSGRPTPGSTSTRRRTATPTCSASSPRSATTRRTTCGSSARPARSCACTREDPGELARLQALQTAKNSAEEVLHPPGDDAALRAPGGAAGGVGRRRDPRVPERARAHRAGARRPRMGELAQRVGAGPGSTAGCGPRRSRWRSTSARRRASTPAGRDRWSSPRRCATRSTSASSLRRNREATRNYSLHTTGWAFDIARDYASKRQALAFQFVLDRLQVLDVIAWVREPGAIHITAASDAEALLPLLERLATAERPRARASASRR